MVFTLGTDRRTEGVGGGLQISGRPDCCRDPPSFQDGIIIRLYGKSPLENSGSAGNRPLLFCVIINILNETLKYPPMTLESLEKKCIMFNVIFLLSKFYFLRAIISGVYVVI